MEELNNDLAQSIEVFGNLLDLSQSKLLEELLLHMLKSKRITVNSLLFATKSALYAHGGEEMIPAVQAIEIAEGAASAVFCKGENA